jgi:hypothetical protein
LANETKTSMIAKCATKASHFHGGDIAVAMNQKAENHYGSTRAKEAEADKTGNLVPCG